MVDFFNALRYVFVYKALFHYRFSHVHCKSCIVGFIERISKGYKSAKRQSTFVVDLIKLDAPNLLLVESPKEDDPRVDQMFIEMVRTFIHKNALREVILKQVPTIMVSIFLQNICFLYSFCFSFVDIYLHCPIIL